MRTSVPQSEHRYWIFTLRISPAGGGGGIGVDERAQHPEPDPEHEQADQDADGGPDDRAEHDTFRLGSG